MGADVATAFGYTNPRKALGDHVDDEDKNTVTIRDGIQGNPNKTIINESGLYSLGLCSKFPQTKVFKHWVTAEVLPSIRRHGALCRSTDVGRKGVTKHSYRMLSRVGAFTRCL